MNAADISAVLVTRGDIDLTPVIESLPFDDIVVWDNSKREQDLKCYGRFAGVADAKNEWIYVQDDDALVPTAGLLRRFNPAEPGVFANKPQSEGWRFLGLGAFFHRETVHCFDRYLELYGFDDDFLRVADIVYAYQQPYQAVDLGYAELEWSRYANRMYRSFDHMAVRERARARTLALPEKLEW